MKKVAKSLFVLMFMLTIVSNIFFVIGCNQPVEPSIQIYGSIKTDYYVGEPEIDLNDAKIIYKDKTGKESFVAVTKDMVSSFSTETEGVKNFIITYQGCTTLCQYTVHKVLDIDKQAIYYTTITDNSTTYYIYLRLLDGNIIKMVKGGNPLLSVSEAQNLFNSATSENIMTTTSPTKIEVIKESNYYTNYYYYSGFISGDTGIVKAISETNIVFYNPVSNVIVACYTKLNNASN